ncbi:L-rhamnose mutarotase [Pseudoalteromonas sp. APAL1]|jgi:L-rhamnose mutarotase|uniref:L-rhamnose mutarotase n=1 Tax=Pseudoalteromonas TaxID=53246 RepID=UPI0018F36022|nr:MULTISPECIES: L-rhamnose mutarotase [unclassified Pseudoalteromonas]MCF2922194.1 L-rhamnose mutarotase [Pseudoalteromonas sp. APAL1]
MQYCLTLELENNDDLIAEYEKYHAPGNVWPEVVAAIKEVGITNMAIHRLGTQLIMILDTCDDFSFEHKARFDAQNSKVQEWEALMEKFQKVDTSSSKSAKWKLVERIFSLDEQIAAY